MIPTRGLIDSQILRQAAPSIVEPTFGQVIGAVAEDTWSLNPTVAAFEADAVKHANFPIYSRENKVSPEEANARYGDLGLSFDNWNSEEALSIIVRRKKEELRRQSILSRAPSNVGLGAAQLLTGLAVSATDPLNIVAAFIPVVGEARYAAWAERFGPAAARFARGAIEGAVGTAAVEPVILDAVKTTHADYDAMDSLLNVAFGTILGGGLHSGLGKISDLMERATPDTREGALRSSVAQAAEGRVVDVEPVIRTDPASHSLSEPLAAVQDAMERLDRTRERLDQTLDTQRQLDAKQAELSSLIDEAANVDTLSKGDSAELISRQLDDVTGQRLQEIETELGQDIPKARRDVLEREKDVIRSTISDEIPLAQERAKAEARGIGAERDRVKAEVQRLQGEVATRQGDVDKAARNAAKADRRLKDLIERSNPEDIPKIIQQAQREVTAETLATAQRYIGEARQKSANPRPDPILGEKASEKATEVAARGDNDLDAELEDIDAQIDGYINQGALPESVRAQIDEGITEASRFGEAARAAARCLLLHP